MNRLISDVLDFARSRLGGGIVIERTQTDLEQLCRVSIDELKASNPNCEISLEVSGDVCGEWDADRVSQVIANLVGNAVKHGGAREAAGSCVRVTLRGDDEAVVMTVHNVGAPISPSKMKHLFEPFNRDAQQRNQGLGLGLYIVKQVVDAHGSKISVESSATGTTFTVRWLRHHPSTIHSIAVRASSLPPEEGA